MDAEHPKIPSSIQCTSPPETNKERRSRDVVCRFRPLSSYKSVILKFSNSGIRRANLHWAIQIGPYMYEVGKRPGDRGFMFKCLHEGEAGFWSSKYKDDVLFSTRMTDEDIYIAVLGIALDMYKHGGYKLSERNCQGFAVLLVEKCYQNSSIRTGRWCNNGCRDPVACLNAQSRHHYDKNHSRLEDLAKAMNAFGRMISPLDVARYLRCSDSNCNLYKTRPGWRLKVA